MALLTRLDAHGEGDGDVVGVALVRGQGDEQVVHGVAFSFMGEGEAAVRAAGS